MSFHFYSNTPAAGNALLANACLLTETSTHSQDWDAENPNAIRLGLNPDLILSPQSLPSFTTRPTGHAQQLCEECGGVKKQIEQLSATNPAILFTGQGAENALGTRNTITGSGMSRSSSNSMFSCSNLTIVSSARTIELYQDGVYMSTFRGEPLLSGHGSDSLPDVPLFKIQIDGGVLLAKGRSLLIKFFIPKPSPRNKQTQMSPNVLNLHWLIVQLRPPSSAGVLDSSSKPREAASSPLGATPFLSSNMSGFSPAMLSSLMLGLSTATTLPSDAPSGSGTVDLGKVREMLGQMQLANLPQGAKDLMKAMEFQEISQGNPSTIGSAAESIATETETATNITSTQQGFLAPQNAPLPLVISSIVPGTEPSQKISSLEPKKQTSQSLYVTMAELAQMEERIMDTIERRFREMEDRIMDKILTTKSRPLNEG
ncbi:hypothetical protein BC939DRAFT_465269 [Gamsiella multidivaricata]|uniref:uncharacterized protein n=1 Tax=Gamsiella multidivaricata TaxID=101098 RepID=UPI00221EB958|nr:uncharacterized protein BC939DRAFT_465269 [Gamsiella multidivaricata]KAG0370989.1 hypothetical protein BGZ54_001754 [Gamsiella multidivaricata]KAI7817684.1 hypothetical protein BC939DRAFT_465269 [Gamsiella multidivaricata]